MMDRRAPFKPSLLVFIEQRNLLVPDSERVVIRNLANRTEVRMSLQDWSILAMQAQYIRARAR